MKQILIFLALVTGIGYGQTLNLVCPSTIRPGSPLTCTIAMAGAASPSAIQWTLTPSQPIGSRTTILSGSLGGFTTATGPTSITLVYDTQTIIPNGTVATVSFAVPTTLSCSGNAPCITLTLGGVFATSLGGTLIPLAPGPAASFGVVNPCSITNGGTGQTTQADVTAELNFVLNAPANTGTAASGDRNGDGLATVVDLQIVINAANGQACTATQ